MDEDQLFFGNSDEYLEDLGASRLRNWRVSTPLLTISCEKSGIPEVPKHPCHWRSAVVNRFCCRFHGFTETQQVGWLHHQAQPVWIGWFDLLSLAPITDQAYLSLALCWTLEMLCDVKNGETTKPQNHHTQWGWFLYWKRIAAFPNTSSGAFLSVFPATEEAPCVEAFEDGIGMIGADWCHHVPHDFHFATWTMFICQH